MASTNRRWLWIVLVLIAASSYGVLSPLIKLAYNAGLNELQVSTGQLAFGTAFLWLAVLLRPRTWQNPWRGPWIRLSLVGFFGLSLTTVFLNSSLLTLNASLSIVLLFQFIWISIAMESILNRKRPHRYQWLAVFIALAGTVLAVGLTVDDFRNISVRGVIFGLLSAVTYSVFLVFTGRIRTDMDSVLKSAVMLTASLPVSVILMIFLFPGQSFAQGDWTNFVFWGAVAGWLGMVIPTIFFNLGIPRIGASLAAMLGSVELPAAVVAAWLVLREPVSLWQWSGILLIILGMILSEKRPA